MAYRQEQARRHTDDRVRLSLMTSQSSEAPSSSLAILELLEI